jgi:hypothetical protein
VPIDLSIIVARLQVDVFPFSSSTGSTRRREQLSRIDPGSFSVATLRGECGKRIIVHNDFHDRGRQRNSISQSWGMFC